MKKKLCCLFKNHKKIAVIKLQGVIGVSSGYGGGVINMESVSPRLDEIFEISNLKAVVIEINSPGGSPVQSELIANKIIRLKKKHNIPVFCFIEDIAASGGYWIACAADEIYSASNSIIGSIGVVFRGFGFNKVIEKLGVERRIYSQGKSKSLLDPFLPEKKEDIKIIQKLQEDIFDNFKEHVRTSRDDRLKSTDEEIFNAEIWSSSVSLKMGIIDGIIEMESFIEKKYGTDVKFIRINLEKSWIKRKIGLSLEFICDSFFNFISTKAL